MSVLERMCSRVVEKTCGSARLTLVSLVFGDRTFHSFSVQHSSTDAHKNTRTLTSGVSLSVLTDGRARGYGSSLQRNQYM